MKLPRIFAAAMFLTVIASFTAFAYTATVDGNITSNTQTMNSVAMEAYRSAIVNNTWNNAGIKAEEFALVDIDNDGIMEVSVKAYIRHVDGPVSCCNYLLYCYEGGLKSADINFGDEYGIDYIDSLDIDRKYIGTGRVRGKDAFNIYSFDKYSGFNDISGWFWGYVTADPNDELSNRQIAQYEQYGQNMFYINYVDATAENINYYLTGSGITTGIGDKKGPYGE